MPGWVPEKKVAKRFDCCFFCDFNDVPMESNGVPMIPHGCWLCGTPCARFNAIQIVQFFSFFNRRLLHYECFISLTKSADSLSAIIKRLLLFRHRNTHGGNPAGSPERFAISAIFLASGSHFKRTALPGKSANLPKPSAEPSAHDADSHDHVPPDRWFEREVH